MTNKARRIGTAWESRVEAYLQERGLAAFRRAQSGNADRGDIYVHLPSITLECKATRAIDLAGAVDEASAEARHAGTTWGAAVIKRRGRGVGDGYFVLPLEAAARLLLAVVQMAPPEGATPTTSSSGAGQRSPPAEPPTAP